MYTFYDIPSKKYNVLKHDESIYEIQLNATGIPKDSITIETVKNKLTIKGEPKEQESTYLYAGFRPKEIFQEFDIEDEIEVDSAKLEDGILSITLKKHIPENMKPKLVEIL